MTTTPTEFDRFAGQPAVSRLTAPTTGLAETHYIVPGAIEKSLAFAACFTLFHGLPMDWFRTRAEVEAAEGNLPMVVVQLLLMGVGIARVAGSVDWLLRVIRLDGALFAFVGWAAASTFWSADPGETARQSIVLLTVTMFAAYLILRYSLAEILQLWAFVFAAGAAASLAFVLWLPIYGINVDRWTGIYEQKNGLGWAALVAVPVLLTASRGTPQLRLVYYLSAVTYLALLIGSQSKTMLLATGGTLTLLASSRLFRGRRTVRGAAVVGLGTAVAATVMLTFVNLEALTALLDRDVSFTGRVPLWQMIIPVVLEQPFVGYGYEAVFTGYFGPTHEIWVLEKWNPRHAHNEALNITLQLGLIGLTIYLVMLTRSVVRALRMMSDGSSISAVWPFVFLSSAVLVSITESGMSPNEAGWMMFVVAALSAAIEIRTAGLDRRPDG